MSDNTILNPGCGGDTIVTEQPGGGTNPKIPVSKIYLGPLDINQGPVWSGNPLPVSFITPTGAAVWQYDEVTLVPPNVETAISTYIVPSGVTFYLVGFVASGDCTAIFKLYIGSNVVFAGRNTPANLTVEVSALQVLQTATTGNSVSLTVLQTTAGVNGNFEGTIIGQNI
jgi:hypothetical protein